MLRIFGRVAFVAAIGVCVGGQAGAAELVLVKESRITALMEDSGHDDRLEASGVFSLEGLYYVVFDNEDRIAVIDDSSWSEDGAVDIGLNHFVSGAEEAEGIAYSPDPERWIIVEEGRLRSEDDEHPVLNGRIIEYRHTSGDDALRRPDSSWLPYNFQRENKGFEGLSLVRHEDKEYVLALCEGNDCDGGRMGKTQGNGRIKVFVRVEDHDDDDDDDDSDDYKYQASIDLPRSLPFVDFSGMDVRDGILAVVSQESSALWIGTLDSANWRIEGDGEVFEFPKDGHSDGAYCNVEGVSWIDDHRLVVVSDATKSGQPESCDAKEQSIHIFRRPVR